MRILSVIFIGLIIVIKCTGSVVANDEFFIARVWDTRPKERQNDVPEYRIEYENLFYLNFDPVYGDLYVVSSSLDGLLIKRLVSKNGKTFLETVAGSLDSEDLTDGLASTKRISPESLNFDPKSGALYFIDSTYFPDEDRNRLRIRRLISRADGQVYIETVAGSLLNDENIDDGPATNVSIDPHSLVFDPIQNELYFVDYQSSLALSLIRKLVLEEGGQTFRIETLTRSDDYSGLAFNQSGEGYFLGPPTEDTEFINKLILSKNKTAQVVTIAGTDTPELIDESGLALRMNVHLSGNIQVHPHGNELYYADQDNFIGRLVERDGQFYFETIRDNQITNNSGARLSNRAKVDKDYPMIIQPQSGTLYFLDKELHQPCHVMRRIVKLQDDKFKIETIAGNSGIVSSRIADSVPAKLAGISAGHNFVFHPFSNDLYYLEQTEIRVLYQAEDQTSINAPYDRGILDLNSSTKKKLKTHFSVPGLSKLKQMRFNEQNQKEQELENQAEVSDVPSSNLFLQAKKRSKME